MNVLMAVDLGSMGRCAFRGRDRITFSYNIVQQAIHPSQVDTINTTFVPSSSGNRDLMFTSDMPRSPHLMQKSQGPRRSSGLWKQLIVVTKARLAFQ